MKNILSLLTIIGIIGIWYFIKKSPNPKYKIYSVALTSASITLLIVVMFLSGDFSKKETTSTVSSSTTATSTASPSSSKSTSSTSQSPSVSSSSSTTETSSSTSTTKTLDAEGGKQFAAYFKQQLDAQYADIGYTFPVTGDETIIYVSVPQDYKYASNADIQKLADNLLSAKNGKFFTWATENNYDYKNGPILYMQAEDGTVLAEEGAFEGDMNVKVKNN